MYISKILRVAVVPVAIVGCSEFFGDDADTFSSAPPAHGVPPVVAAPPAPPAPPGPRGHRGRPGHPARPGPGNPPYPKTPPSTQTGCSCPAEVQQQAPVAPVPAPVAPVEPAAPVAPAPEWHPNEGQLVRAGDLVVALRRAGGVYPTHAAMVTHIQNNMGVSAQQAERILEELGL